jgi:hypothetical protein
MRIMKLLLTVIIIGALMLLGFSFLLGFDEIVRTVQSADYGLLGIACGFQVLALFAVCLRWDFLLKSERIDISTPRLFLISLAGLAFTNLTPTARFGGEPIRAYFLKKNAKIRGAESLATIIAERTYDAVTFSILSFAVILLAIFWLALPLWIIALMIVAFLLCAGLLCGIVFFSVNHKAGVRFTFWVTKNFDWLIRRFGSVEVLRKKLISDVRLYGKKVKKYLMKPSFWGYGLVYSLLVWWFDILMAYFVFLSLGFTNISIALIAAVIVISALAGAFPALPGGLGITEAVMVVIFSAASVPLAVAGMATIISRLISYWAVTFVGLGAAYYIGVQDYGK